MTAARGVRGWQRSSTGILDLLRIQDDRELVRALIEHIHEREYDRRPLGRGERFVSDVSWLRFEVNNGGFAQYFESTWGHRIPAMRGLEAIEAEHWTGWDGPTSTDRRLAADHGGCFRGRRSAASARGVGSPQAWV